MTRGGFGSTAAGAALAALLAGPSVADGTGGGTKRTVVLTGASSGIGLDAATKLVRVVCWVLGVGFEYWVLGVAYCV